MHSSANNKKKKKTLQSAHAHARLLGGPDDDGGALHACSIITAASKMQKKQDFKLLGGLLHSHAATALHRITHDATLNPGMSPRYGGPPSPPSSFVLSLVFAFLFVR